MSLDPERGSVETAEKSRPAPITVPGRAQTRYSAPDPNMPDWPYPSPDTVGREMDIQYAARAGSSASGSMLTPRRVTFFDVGGLLEDEPARRTSSASPIIDLYADSSSITGQEWGNVDNHSGSRALVQDMGGTVPSPSSSSDAQQAAVPQESTTRRGSKMAIGKPLPDPPSTSRRSRSSLLPNSPLSRSQNVQQLQDVGGLLSR